MASSSGRLVIPLERISHVTTATLAKKDLVQWVHITGRSDLSVVFEQEPNINSTGYLDQQTLMNIKEGIKSAETVVLEDFVCQASVAERWATTSPNSPPPFAIFVSSPNLAFRYQLLNGHFRKIQLLFRDSAGFELAVSVLKRFNLPLVDKASTTRRDADTTTSAHSVPSYLSRGAPTVFSEQSDNGETIDTAYSWHGPQKPARIVSDSYSTRTVLPPQVNKTSNIANIHPHSQGQSGPSLVESTKNLNQRHDDKRRQNRDGDRSQQHELDSPSHLRRAPLRKSLFGQSPILGRAIDFDWTPENAARESSGILPPVLKPSWLSKTNSSYEDIPPSAQRRPLDAEAILSQDSTTDRGNKTKDLGRMFIPHIPKPRKNTTRAESYTASTQVKPQSTQELEVAGATLPLQTKRPPARKRAPKKTFKNSAVQTEILSISKSTQTMGPHFYASASIQTIPMKTDSSRIEQRVKNQAFSTAQSMARISQILQPLSKQISLNMAQHNTGGSSLVKISQPRINKFGRRSKIHPQIKGKSITQTGKTSHHGRSLGINKFGRRL